MNRQVGKREEATEHRDNAITRRQRGDIIRRKCEKDFKHQSSGSNDISEAKEDILSYLLNLISSDESENTDTSTTSDTSATSKNDYSDETVETNLVSDTRNSHSSPGTATSGRNDNNDADINSTFF